MDLYTYGQQDTYRALGLSKEAAMPRTLVRLGKFLKRKLPSRQGLKKFFVGRPGRAAHEWRMKQSLKPGSVFREGFSAPGPVNKALLYGFPAYEGINIAQGEKGERAERIGGLLGGTALGLAAWGPGGILGSMAAGMAGERLGRGLGRTAKYVGRTTPRVAKNPESNLTLGYNTEPSYTWR